MANNSKSVGSGVSNVVLGIIALIVLALLILLLVEVMRPKSVRPPLPILPAWLGGCDGTRYGCCPDGETAKADASGWNTKEASFNCSFSIELRNSSYSSVSTG